MEDFYIMFTYDSDEKCAIAHKRGNLGFMLLMLPKFKAITKLTGDMLVLVKCKDAEDYNNIWDCTGILNDPITGIVNVSS